MRVGVFGGTFDPVHVGHLILAEQCRAQAALDQVLFVPAASPPHKQGRELTPFAHRVEMLTLAISGHPAFRVDELEKDRMGPSYTVETLTQLHERRPGDELFFILGSDSVRELHLWYQPHRILELATLLVVERPDSPGLTAAELKDRLQVSDVQMQHIEAPLIGVSSSDLRKRLAEGRSVRYIIPRAVEAYIEDKHLYRENQS
jgi:nicotinate-nucleotide adenylyltransferase